MMIYISAPYGGKKENKDRIEFIVKTLSIERPFDTFISPVHCWGFMYDTVAYNVGIRYCLELLDKCDFMMVFGDWRSSRGCRLEVEHAKINEIPFIVYEDVEGDG